MGFGKKAVEEALLLKVVEIIIAVLVIIVLLFPIFKFLIQLSPRNSDLANAVRVYDDLYSALGSLKGNDFSFCFPYADLGGDYKVSITQENISLIHRNIVLRSRANPLAVSFKKTFNLYLGQSCDDSGCSIFAQYVKGKTPSPVDFEAFSNYQCALKISPSLSSTKHDSNVGLVAPSVSVSNTKKDASTVGSSRSGNAGSPTKHDSHSKVLSYYSSSSPPTSAWKSVKIGSTVIPVSFIIQGTTYSESPNIIFLSGENKIQFRWFLFMSRDFESSICCLTIKGIATFFDSSNRKIREEHFLSPESEIEGGKFTIIGIPSDASSLNITLTLDFFRDEKEEYLKKYLITKLIDYKIVRRGKE